MGNSTPTIANKDHRIRSFVLRSGRMSRAQKRSYEDKFSIYGVGEDKAGFLDGKLLFGNSSPMVIEIGFGMGTATAAIAEQNPGINYLGIEVHRPGIGRLLWEIEKRGLGNIRIIEGDAVDILEKRIKDSSVSGFHIFFPDPWPKKRHHKRRLITWPFTGLLAAKLLPDGYIYMVTDWADYGNWALGQLSATPGLANKYEAFAENQSWRPQTEFERKGIMRDHGIMELYFNRISGKNKD